ncbi:MULTISPECIES: 2-hydroxymuconate tautomerase [Staphylococcus]|uniref:Tautomerase n=2 Tax=Staphylococcus TaxID=1279 RepID=A0A1Z3TYM6_9STAP|nr:MULTISPECIES: 2-hydroxymuconate tautomerase [Staphylococcus]ASE36020.1 4-oxalocrotonate tautomerase [Staphylococcus pettenkoferi]EHM70451.1 4-oxalocrotonate tautomerase family enzyme [Staphylococcus pettenkoferi VCU012]MBX8992560.1 4-oxalocrotonate tautomerase [Staphylococcus pettenkoferi]MCI2790337.1 4-oxalocrotonate tautomerase [Staphylococcus pettenkoferi]MCI2802548.1 4-oxalocrotonate tautomerase [Staphylococcus pettenkoferi]
MPIINVKLIEGRSDEQLKDLVTEVTNAVEKSTGANREAIHVIIEEMKKEHYGVAGVRKSDE